MISEHYNKNGLVHLHNDSGGGGDFLCLVYVSTTIPLVKKDDIKLGTGHHLKYSLKMK